MVLAAFMVQVPPQERRETKAFIYLVCFWNLQLSILLSLPTKLESSGPGVSGLGFILKSSANLVQSLCLLNKTQLFRMSSPLASQALRNPKQPHTAKNGDKKHHRCGYNPLKLSKKTPLKQTHHCSFAFVLDRVSLCSPGWTRTYSNALVSASPVLRLQV